MEQEKEVMFFPAILVKVESAENMSIYDMKEFQRLENGDELKTLSDDHYEKFKENILENGIFVPFQIWKHNGENYIIDGHQRWKTLRRMRGEGFEIPEVPVSIVEADTMEEAKQKLIYQNTTYGKMNEDRLKRIALESKLQVKEILANYVNPIIDNKKILKDIDKIIEKAKETINDTGDKKDDADTTKNGKSKIVHECPECGCKFSSSGEKVNE